MSAHQFLAPLRETLVTLAITVPTADGVRHATEFQLTYYRPQGDGPFPLAVFHHGRGADNSYPSRSRGGLIVEYLARRGFAVLLPTRVGYGGLGRTVDPEVGPGGCNLAAAERQIANVLAHTEAAIAFARRQPWADAGRVLIAGGSVGGYTSVVIAGRGVAGVIGVLNFAGGTGGNPKRRPATPCNPERLSQVLAAAGRGSRVATLWVYAENDKFWGPKHPRDWHRAFVAGGGNAELLMLGPLGSDGHEILVPGFPQWRPVADRFLERLGFPPPRTPDAPPATAFAALADESKVPANDNARTSGYARFLRSDLPRAFVIAPNGGWAFASGRVSSLVDALARCAAATKMTCKPYAVDDSVVWPQ